MEKEPRKMDPDTFLSNAGIKIRGIYMDAYSDANKKVERKSLPKKGEIFKVKGDASNMSGRIHLE